MKIAVIDIGSNSVRLMLWADGKTLYKRMHTTRLGEGLNNAPKLLPQAISRTAQAIADYKKEAEATGADKIYAFATAAVRSSVNKDEFIQAVRKLCGIQVEVISGEKEAEVGLLGALGMGDGGIIDVGGASTEVTVRMGGKLIYSHSANIGTVRILDAAGRDLNKIKEFVNNGVQAYTPCDFSNCNMVAVGGTASRLAAIKHGIKEYDANILNGTVLTAKEIEDYAKLLTDWSVEEIRGRTICTKSADLIGGGAALMAAVMRRFNIQNVTVSESDNLEGYLLDKLQRVNVGDTGETI